jgi:hypothetical protein
MLQHRDKNQNRLHVRINLIDRLSPAMERSGMQSVAKEFQRFSETFRLMRQLEL